ncbi:MAG: DUF4872 domain-containing protein [Planctomycetaceae bacterium]|nr:DUF4872 domain-containing protein [Planctomycetaceae bacterium]MBT6495978.1 DUF4872 domain-containing protein [Planctomycetaceae bacterium]
MYSYIHYGTGGGLTRPLYAQFFREANQAIGNGLFQELAERYEKLGIDWDDLGEAALPNDIELFRRFRQLCARLRTFPNFNGRRKRRIRVGHSCQRTHYD